MEAPAEAPDAASSCEIARVPEDLLAASIARTAPRDSCRAAAVSRSFLAAADSDAVWAGRIPRDLPPLAHGELSPAPASRKELYMRLSAGPVLLDDGLTSMWLDRETGAKCFMLSARALGIAWGDTPQYWRWIPLTDSRSAEGAELLHVCWLEIRGKIHSRMLSQNTTYAAYMVFRVSNEPYGLDDPPQEAAVIFGESISTRQVCLQVDDNEGEDEEEVTPKYHPFNPAIRLRRRSRPVPHEVTVPKSRADGWMEMEMGEFIIEEGEDGEVSIRLMEIKRCNGKRGLIVQGIEIRAKK